MFRLPRLGKLIVLLVLIFVVAACDNDKDTDKSPSENLAPRLQEIQKNDKLVVGTAITRPFEYYDDNGKLIGFDVDLMNAIAKKLGVTVEWREMAFADLLPTLANGDVDVVIAAMYIRPDREEIVDMSQPYVQTGLIMAVHVDNTDVTDLDSLVGKSVGVKEQSTGARYAEQLIADGTALDMRIYTDTLDSLDDLDQGLLDVVFNDRLNTLIYIQDHPNVRLQGDVFDPAGLGISVKTGDTELLTFINETLDSLEASGEIETLFNQWINPQSTTAE